MQLSLKLDSSKEKYEQELHELNERMSKNSEDHKVEIANLIKEHDELIGGVKKVYQYSILILLVFLV